MTITLILLMIYFIGVTLTALVCFNDYMDAGIATFITLSWPILAFYAIGVKVFN